MGRELDNLSSAIGADLAKLSRYAPHISAPSGHLLPLGSGKEGTFITSAPCANITCASDSTLAHECPKCRLVAYCSPACKAGHAQIHSRVCGTGHLREAHHLKTAHLKAEAESRINEHHFSSLWGSLPAISLVNPKRAASLPADLSFCFAASGDLRDVFTTLSKLPRSFTGRVQILINDFDADVSNRNFAMLELLRLYGREAIECVIALWYSLGMTQSQSLACKAATFNAMERFGCWTRMASRHTISLPTPVPAAFARGKSTLTVDFPDRCWARLMSCLCGTFGASEVAELRNSASIWKELGSFAHWESGLLLPFAFIGQMQYSAGNCFLLRSNHSGFTWPASCHADVLSGWDFDDLMLAARECGCPSRDYYGALFFYCKRVLSSAVDALERCEVEIKLTCIDAHLLAERLKSSGATKFNAIATSNIGDSTFMGPQATLADWGPLLKKSSGILITMSRIWCLGHSREEVIEELEWRGRGRRPRSGARDQLVWNSSNEAAFERRMRVIYAVAKGMGLEARRKHLLVPRRLYVPVDASPGACPGEYRREEVLERGSRSWTFMERYVEWQPLKS